MSKNYKAHKSSLNSHSVLEAVLSSKQPLKLEQLAAKLKLDRRAHKALLFELSALQSRGEMLYLPGGFYATPSQLRQITGRLEVQRSGVGFVISQNSQLKGQDVYISPNLFGRAMNGDTVLVGLLSEIWGRRGKSPEGLVLKVLERRNQHFMVRVLKTLGPGEALATGTNPRETATWVVNCRDLPEPPLKGDILQVAVEEPGPNNRDAGFDFEPSGKGQGQLWQAKALLNLGRANDVAAQEEIVKLTYNINTSFPAAALAEAARLPLGPEWPVPESSAVEGSGSESFAPEKTAFANLSSDTGAENLQGRVDLRHKDFVTIDGLSAKDFDDAIYVERGPHGKGYTLFVSIADVTHYVRPGSALDAEAALRGNSYYFARSVEPMLPEALSNGLCSLRPQEDRLTVTVEMNFSGTGQAIGAPSLYFSIIKSRARLIYEQVHRALDLQNELDRALLEPVLPMLQRAKELALLLQKGRVERGGLFLDLPEVEAVLGDKGQVLDIRLSERTFAHQMIEEFMIAANEAVAEFLTARGEIFPYRVHPYPDAEKIEALFKTLSRSGLVSIAPNSDAEALPRLLNTVRGQEGEYVAANLILRSMMQARYQSELEGHFGLASECYCHFTSPIRRYADVLVHRALRRALKQAGGGSVRRGALNETLEQINICEKTARDAEFELDKRLAILFMQNKIGEEFTGVVSGVTDFGVFVELEENLVEGMIRLQSLDDYFVFFPERHELVGQRSGRRFRLGQKVQVKLVEAHLDNLELTFELAEEASKQHFRAKRSEGRSGGRFGGRSENYSEKQPARSRNKSRRPA